MSQIDRQITDIIDTVIDCFTNPTINFTLFADSKDPLICAFTTVDNVPVGKWVVGCWVLTSGWWKGGGFGSVFANAHAQ